MSHDLGVGDLAISSDGRYKIEAASVEMKLTVEAVARRLRLFVFFITFR